jgi:hypothetical protein
VGIVALDTIHLDRFLTISAAFPTMLREVEYLHSEPRHQAAAESPRSPIALKQ